MNYQRIRIVRDGLFALSVLSAILLAMRAPASSSGDFRSEQDAAAAARPTGEFIFLSAQSEETTTVESASLRLDRLLVREADPSRSGMIAHAATGS